MLSAMAVHVRTSRGDKENNMGVLRRFRQSTMGWGGLRKVRGKRYFSRTESTFVKRKSRLKSIAKKKVRTRLYKLGLVDRA